MTVVKMNFPLLQLENVGRDFVLSAGIWSGKSSILRAVHQESLTLQRGEILGIVGESGCGKSTLASLVTGVREPSRGRIFFDGQDITHLKSSARRASRRRIQIVFQNPASALNPRMRILTQVKEGLIVHGIGDPAGRENLAREALLKVGLADEMVMRYPHQLSGGQQQRAAIARAIVTSPELIVLDEAVSALDVSVKAQVINLLKHLKRSMGLSYLFISHDLAVVRQLCDRVAVMLGGRIVELAPADELFREPRHPFTRTLIEAIPHPDPDVPFAPLPPVIDRKLSAERCPFADRCTYMEEVCAGAAPLLSSIDATHQIGCHIDPFAPSLERAAL
ncbi:oligopeptide/dipeptide ABC transporter ATP-binding protein [Aquamicrobium sp. LC103]|uniref:oligopeptide/dipeptide ABC transporter ATP-binding protein n=1 Tax=Aquamicrobium sp. LC103 TaxID=1120658 RepID=UPI000699C0C3|nr:oligopeptide/dipeptide ABC transporter ATP-binding protein [Aquamicrobium sp. LC103]TKT82430.1 ABC transporter ATP-binding protein [Aquamicrobium sp. LC103]